MPDITTPFSVATQTPAPAVPSDADFLRTFLAERDVPCPLCGYNLRALSGDRCPECGDQIVLQVNPVEPKQAAAITGLILLAAGAGFNGLLLIYGCAIALIHPGSTGAMAPFFIVNGIGFLAEAIAVGFWVQQWKRIRRLPAFWRWSLALGLCGFITLADLVIFITVVR